ncbi:hypothetical protein J6590_104750, partial [Homalodisca vitripennis]
ANLAHYVIAAVVYLRTANTLGELSACLVVHKTNTLVIYWLPQHLLEFTEYTSQKKRRVRGRPVPGGEDRPVSQTIAEIRESSGLSPIISIYRMRISNRDVTQWTRANNYPAWGETQSKIRSRTMSAVQFLSSSIDGLIAVKCSVPSVPFRVTTDGPTSAAQLSTTVTFNLSLLTFFHPTLGRHHGNMALQGPRSALYRLTFAY